jgi:hypothetical protein
MNKNMLIDALQEMVDLVLELAQQTELTKDQREALWDAMEDLADAKQAPPKYQGTVTLT